jgi:Kae1-associated kinase Bud32
MKSNKGRMGLQGNAGTPVAQGAEAIISKEDGKILKDRIAKGYRIPALDNRLRKLRTRNEAKLLSEARRARVPTPQVIEVSETKIVMEDIEGETVKVIFNNIHEERSDELKKSTEMAYNIGQLIARLHKAGIVHGDLTTSNMILRNDELVFIDFGLGFFSTRTEDYGQDLAVLKEAIKATHFQLFEQLWKEIQNGYLEEWPEENIFKVLEAIEKRGRYVKKN